MRPLVATGDVTPALPRDRATDQSNLEVWRTLGFTERDPQTGQLVLATPQPPNLGRQTRTTPVTNQKTGRPDFYRTERMIVHERNLRALAPKAIGPGTIRRNVQYPVRGGGVRSLFSRAGSASGDPPRPFDISNPAEYLVSSVHLQLPQPLAWVVAGKKPSIPDGPHGQHTHISGARATGFPVVAPNVPSFGSRVPLRRPRDLVAANG